MPIVYAVVDSQVASEMGVARNAEVRECPWCYWYDVLLQRWVYLGPPSSPRCVLDR